MLTLNSFIHAALATTIHSNASFPKSQAAGSPFTSTCKRCSERHPSMARVLESRRRALVAARSIQPLHAPFCNHEYLEAPLFSLLSPPTLAYSIE